MKLVILGPPRTKKNSLRRIKRGKRVFTVGSEAHKAWEDSAVAQLLRAFRPGATRTTGVDHRRGIVTIGTGPIVTPLAVRALVYRKKNCGDLVGYLQSIGDALEKGGVIQNDRLIASWDGSRLLKDAKNPRVEIYIEPMEETA